MKSESHVPWLAQVQDTDLLQQQQQQPHQHTFGLAGGAALIDEGRPQPAVEEAVFCDDWYSQVNSTGTCNGASTIRTPSWSTESQLQQSRGSQHCFMQLSHEFRQFDACLCVNASKQSMPRLPNALKSITMQIVARNRFNSFGQGLLPTLTVSRAGATAASFDCIQFYIPGPRPSVKVDPCWGTLDLRSQTALLGAIELAMAPEGMVRAVAPCARSMRR